MEAVNHLKNLAVLQKIILLFIIFSSSLNVFAQKLTFDDGAYYIGQLENGKPNGMGMYHFAKGSEYYGEWKNDQQNGYGFVRSSNGKQVRNCKNCTFYVGYWKDGLKSGEGTCYDSLGKLIYKGEFLDDKPIDPYPSQGDYTAYELFHGNFYESSFYSEKIKEINNGFSLYIMNQKDGSKLYTFGIYVNGKEDGKSIMLHSDGRWTIFIKKNDKIISSVSLGDKEHKIGLDKLKKATDALIEADNRESAKNEAKKRKANNTSTENNDNSISIQQAPTLKLPPVTKDDVYCSQLKERYAKCIKQLEFSIAQREESLSDKQFARASLWSTQIKNWKNNISDIESEARRIGCSL